jgi:hypothetical protein
MIDSVTAAYDIFRRPGGPAPPHRPTARRIAPGRPSVAPGRPVSLRPPGVAPAAQAPPGRATPVSHQNGPAALLASERAEARFHDLAARARTAE